MILSQEESREADRIKPWHLVVVAVLVFGCYLGSASVAPVAEDYELFSIGSKSLRTMIAEIAEFDRWRPLAFFFAWISLRLSDMSWASVHVMNIILHVLNCVLVYAFSYLFTKSGKNALYSSLIFSVYPRNHQSVIWPAASLHTLCLLFMLLSLIAYKLYFHKPQPIYLIFGIISTILALSSHEVAVILFALLLMMNVAMDRENGHGRWPSKRAITCYLPYLGVLIIYIVANGAAALTQSSGGDALESAGNLAQTDYHLSVGLNAARSFGAYLVYTALPFVILRSLDASFLTAILAVSVLGILALFFLRGPGIIRIGVIWILLPLTMFSLLVPFGNADRYFYLPSVGVSLITAELMVSGERSLRKLGYRIVRFLAPAFVLGYVVISFVWIQVRMSEWHVAGRVFADIIDQTVRLYPDPPAETTFLFVSLPATHGQAYVALGGGVNGAVRLAYEDNSLYAFQTRDPQVCAYLANSTASGGGIDGLCVLFYQNGTIIDKSDSVDDMGALREDTWY